VARGAAQADSGGVAPNPHLVRETSGLAPGRALDAGCGTGAEATWLAARGWQVTGADISGAALAQAAERAEGQSVPGKVTWVEAGLTSWSPGGRLDLVTTHYAHPSMPQLAFYERISDWVAPGGTLLMVGHLHSPDSPGHGHRPPPEATVTLAEITGGLDTAVWNVTSAEETTRTLPEPVTVRCRCTTSSCVPPRAGELTVSAALHPRSRSVRQAGINRVGHERRGLVRMNGQRGVDDGVTPGAGKDCLDPGFRHLLGGTDDADGRVRAGQRCITPGAVEAECAVGVIAQPSRPGVANGCRTAGAASVGT
jgi:SAM-dependent methyltransferase